MKKRRIYIIVGIIVIVIGLTIFSIIPRSSQKTIDEITQLPAIGDKLLPLQCTSPITYHRIDGVRGISVLAIGHADFDDFKKWATQIGFDAIPKGLVYHMPRSAIQKWYDRFGVSNRFHFSSSTWYFSGRIRVPNKTAYVIALADPKSSVFIIEYGT